MTTLDKVCLLIAMVCFLAAASLFGMIISQQIRSSALAECLQERSLETDN